MEAAGKAHRDRYWLLTAGLILILIYKNQEQQAKEDNSSTKAHFTSSFLGKSGPGGTRTHKLKGTAPKAPKRAVISCHIHSPSNSQILQRPVYEYLIISKQWSLTMVALYGE